MPGSFIPFPVMDKVSAQLSALLMISNLVAGSCIISPHSDICNVVGSWFLDSWLCP